MGIGELIYTATYTLIVSAVLSYISLLILNLFKKVGVRKWVVLPGALVITNSVFSLVLFDSKLSGFWLFWLITALFLAVVYVVAKFFWKLDQNNSLKFTAVYIIASQTIGNVLSQILAASLFR